MSKPKKDMKVVSIVDSWGRVSSQGGEPKVSTTASGTLQESRQLALCVIQKVCRSLEAELENVQFEKLDFGETSVLDLFYNADVVIVDMSIPVQQSALFYHIGVRQSMEMKFNIVLHYDVDPEQSLALRLSCGNNVLFFPYLVDNNKTCVVVENSTLPQNCCVHPEKGQQSLFVQLKKKLSEMEKENTVHIKERFLNDLRKARDQYKGEELVKVLEAMRTRLDDPQLLCVEVVMNMLISLRETQNYDAMVKLVEDLEQIPQNKITGQFCVMYYYAFALNRRNRDRDRSKALKVILEAIRQTENPSPDMLCLCGRIYKDLYIDSDYTDRSMLDNAVQWYRKGFDRQPNEYAGINLATLLVISGKDFASCSELQRIGLVLNNLIGKKGSLTSLQDYWDVATFFEISVLAQDYGKAVQAAECMFRLEPPNWYLKSTVGNIALIMRFKKKTPSYSKELQLFNFWMEFFAEACKTDPKELTSSSFPVLVQEPTKVLMPSYVQINWDEETKEVRLWHDYPESDCCKDHEWTFPATTIKGVSLYRRDCRAVFLYVQENSDDFHIYFSSELQRRQFYKTVSDMIKDQADSQVFDESVDEYDSIEYQYELDEKNQRVVLGRGTFGTVYAARDTKTQVRIAVKEIPEKNTQEVQPLHEEIKLHSRLSHRNIVKYLGSLSEDGYFKIVMEQVPGGSLSALLLSKWGPLKDNETTIAYYSKQILEGLKYLHDNKIVHRDIKGDNVLVNTYSGLLKISDFGTSKRLSGINPCAETFAGTIQYMAPEVIDKGLRGYGPPADIWSLGCTVIEMATGKLPFIELGSPEAAMFKVGFYKMHPEIPDTMSENAKDFLLKTFEPKPELRARAEDLLKHPFIVETLAKKKKKRASDGEYLRSISMPTGQEGQFQHKTTMQLQLPKKKREPKSPASSIGSNDTMDLDDYDTAEEKDREIDLKYHRSRSVHTGFLAMDRADRKIDLVFRKRAGSDSKFLERGSSDAGSSGMSGSSSMLNLSPDIGDMDHNSHDSSGLGGFYLLRKDSERRITLVHILTKDMEQICETWLQFLHKDATISNPKLCVEHLRWMLVSLKNYISDPNCKHCIKDTLEQLRQAVDFDAAALMEIQLALYVFHEAVSKHLKSHSIQPHWMFALDNLLRGAVQEAIMILSPDLGANIAGSKEEEIETSGVPSTNSGKSALLYRSSAVSELQNQLESIQEENMQLLQQLVDVNRMYGDVLRKTIEEKKTHLENMQALSSINNVTEAAALSNARVPAIHEPPDEALVLWLRNRKFDEDLIETITQEQFVLSDLLEIVRYEDLQRLGLRGGVLCRLWRVIQSHRKEHGLEKMFQER
ncbi:mitogen-activated protein kinase kinase kinase 15-like isoform X3 [Crassostrea angulata]|uniref:mitogen-activated protein kinase kinase kinase 15-like isoform X3 n=1 Tax=Magallana angulata TaxID=2784310 RepID=UPI0022B090F0|nr:mitogen-activated protein kinase kinase kinase 15-like isoform X3 [Crassostrea angulata]